MTKQDPIPADPPAVPAEEDDTEGQAFTWRLVEEAGGSKRLRQTYTPDDAPAAKGARGHATPDSRAKDAR